MKDLNKKTILITGAASGIGKALSLEFAKLGSSLVLLDINKEGLKKLKNKIENQYETNVKAIKCDLTNKKNIQKIPNDILKEIDILINNAGAGAKGFFNDRTYDEFEFIANINYLSVVQLTHKFLKTTDFNKMKYIINISSPAGFLDVPYMSAYSSSKKAITSFTKCLQIELYDKNLKIMCAIPGPAKNTNFGKNYGNLIKHGWFYNKFFTYSPYYIATKIIKGIKKNKEYVYAPYLIKIVIIISNIFPWLRDYFSKKTIKKIREKSK